MGLINLLNDEVGSFKFYRSKGYTGNGNEPGMKSLKFGKDRPGGGDSGQPYIQNSIASNIENLPYNNPDFLLRGGINAPLNAADDVVRLTKYMFSTKNPSGLLFIAKQNLLSRVSPKTEASFGGGYLGFNAGIYTPLSTLAQAGVGFTGTHLNQKGIDPTGLIQALSIRKYEDVISAQIYNDKRSKRFETKESSNRLFRYLKDNILQPSFDSLDSYSGGPNSILGIGRTQIKFATNNEGVNLKSMNLTSPTSWKLEDIYNINRVSTIGYDPISKIRSDFREKFSAEAQKTTSISLNYSGNNNIETKFNLGNPGQKGDVSDFTKGKLLLNAVSSSALDKINAYPIYKSEIKKPREDNELTDLIPFRIAILNNENELGGPFAKFIHFRAFIDSFSDSYNADWDKVKYMGRAENFYKYKGFERDISLGFTVVAQSKDELSIMYDKLNFLASSLAPEYLDSGDSSGYMAGNIAYLTLGDYIVEQPGIITSLTFDIPEDSSWEIGIGRDGNPYSLQEKMKDQKPRQLPHMIKVTGFKFIPIHEFRAEKVRWRLEHWYNKGLEGTTFQKYIDPLKKFTTPPPIIENPTPTNNLSTSQGIPS
jgi:hypothetical protein